MARNATHQLIKNSFSGFIISCVLLWIVLCLGNIHFTTFVFWWLHLIFIVYVVLLIKTGDCWFSHCGSRLASWFHFGHSTCIGSLPLQEILINVLKSDFKWGLLPRPHRGKTIAACSWKVQLPFCQHNNELLLTVLSLPQCYHNRRNYYKMIVGDPYSSTTSEWKLNKMLRYDATTQVIFTGNRKRLRIEARNRMNMTAPRTTTVIGWLKMALEYGVM